MKELPELPDEWPAPNAYMTELGRMTCLWGSLEAAVNIAISKLAGYEEILDYRAVIMVAHANFQQRIDMVSSFCEQLSPDYPHLSDYKATISKVKRAQKLRNKFAHNGVVYTPEDGRVTISTASARGSLKAFTEDVTIDQIRGVSVAIHEALCMLQELVTNKPMLPFWDRHA